MGTTTLMSLQEFERLDEPNELELLKGELLRMPPPQFRHMSICEQLYKLLDAAVDRLRKSDPDIAPGPAHMEMGYYFPGDPPSWLRPDVSIAHRDQLLGRYYEGAPLIAFEIVSESDTAAALESKVSEYLAHGGAEVWVIYPETRHAWVYAHGASSARRETQAVRSELLPGIEIGFERFL
jgi:Uma2 family endonuclease